MITPLHVFRCVTANLVATFCACLFFTGPAVAFDFGDLSNAPAAVRACMDKKLSPELLRHVKAGTRPGDRETRKRIVQAYRACLDISGTETPPAYDGPLFDAMSQIDERVPMDKVMARVRAAGISKLALFARSRNHLHQNEGSVLTLAQRYPDLIVLGAPKFFRLSGDLTDAYIQSTLKGIQRHGYRFIGEVLYTHGDKKSGVTTPRGERYVDPLGPGTAELLKAIAPYDIPFMTHWEAYAPERDFPRFHQLYDTWPKQRFILPHMGFAKLEQVESFLSRHPNLYVLTSKRERFMGNFSDDKKRDATGPPLLEGKVLKPQWRDLLIRYQDRILFATDPHMRRLWQKYAKAVAGQRAILGQLPRSVAEKIAYKNAERLYGVALGD